MRRIVRVLLVLQALLLLVVGLGLLLDAGWARQLWPWPDGRLSYLFVASMMLAQAGSIGWVAWTLDVQAVRGGLLGFAAACLGIALYAWRLTASIAAPALWGWALAAGVMGLGALGLLMIRGQFPIRDARPVPAFVRGSFLLFSIALAIATALLLSQATVVFPWPLKPESSVIFGFLFLASACYFFHGWLRPSISNARGQLIGFLIYDLVLLPPFIAQWPSTAGAFRISMAIYLVVLVWSGALAVWFLVRPATRGRVESGWESRAA